METHLRWWSSLDTYWKRYFKIMLRPELDANREERDRYVPDAKELQSIFDLHHLELRNVSVSTLKPLEDLHLTSLYLNSLPSLKTIEGIEKLNLASFEMRDCRVTNLVPLESVATLRELQLAGNHLINSKSIGKLKKLTYLLIDEAELEEVECFHELPLIEELICVNLNLDLSPLSKLKNLKKLRITNSTISSLESITPLPSLTLLDLNTIEMQSLKGIDKFPGLIELFLHQCTTVDLELIEKLPNLRSLNVGHTAIKDLTVLDHCVSLSEIFIPEDNFSREQILAFKALHPDCNVYSERGKNFPFMKYKEYTVIKEMRELKSGMIIRFTGYTYNHYDGVDIYYFTTANGERPTARISEQEDFLWRDYVSENEVSVTGF